MSATTNWVTFLASNDRRGGTPAARTSAPKELIWKVTLPDRCAPARCCATACSTSPAATASSTRSTADGARNAGRIQAAARCARRRRSPEISCCSVVTTARCTRWIARRAGSRGRRRWAGNLDVARRVRRRRVRRIDERRVRAVDRGTGKVRWKRQFDGQICSTPMRPSGWSISAAATASSTRSIPRPARTSGRTRRTTASRAPAVATTSC